MEVILVIGDEDRLPARSAGEASLNRPALDFPFLLVYLS